MGCFHVKNKTVREATACNEGTYSEIDLDGAGKVLPLELILGHGWHDETFGGLAKRLRLALERSLYNSKLVINMRK